MRLSSDPVCRLCRLAFGLTMSLVWAQPPQAGWGAEATAGAARADTAARVEQVKNSLRALEDSLKRLPRDSFDLQAVIQKTGNDPAALFGWVRDHTCWAPYRGLLREDIGVLMDRTGNSLDRGYLLASLLKATGHEARLAHAQLGASLAMKLLAKVRAQPVKEPVAGNLAAKTDVFADAACQYQIDEAAARKKVAQFAAHVRDVRQKVQERTAEQSPLVSSELALTGKANDTWRDEAVLALQDHWWVQWHNGGQWVDLDVLLPDSKPGATVATAQQTFDPASLPDELRQQVIVRVVIERWQDKKPSEAAVLEHAFRPAAVVGKEVRFGNYPMAWPADFNAADPRDLESRVKSAVLAQHEWVPVLMVGSETIMQGSFAENGQVNPKPNLAADAAAGKTVASAGQSVLDAFGGGNAAPPAPAGAVTAQWLEYELRVPGNALRKVRRQIFDLIGPAARASAAASQPELSDAQRLSRGLDLFGETDILISGCRLSAPYMTGLGIESLLANRKLILAAAARDPALSNPATAKAFLTDMKPMPGDLEELAFARLTLGRYQDNIFLAQPNILTRHVRLHTEASGHLMGCRAFDIVANDLGVRPGSEADPFAIRLERGVIDTNLESALLSGCGLLHSAAETFATAGNDPKQWTILKGAHDSALSQLPISADVRTRIAADLSSGATVIVPRNPIQSNPSWWRIDPATGTALGIGENGWGQTIAEYAFLMFVTFSISFVYCQFSLADSDPYMHTYDSVTTCFALAIAMAMLAVGAMVIMEGFDAMAASNAMNYGDTMPGLGGGGAGF